MTDILQLALQAGFSQAAELNTAALKALPEVRDMCAADRCHVYGKRWSCPPGCGTLEENQKKMSLYPAGILVQTTGTMEDDFDVEAIGRIQSDHKKQFETLVRQIRTMDADCLPLTAGCCTICRKCTYPTKPCRFPGKMYSSMEAYGLLVSDVCEKSGLKYYYGPRTMTYTSCVLTNLNIKGR